MTLDGARHIGAGSFLAPVLASVLPVVGPNTIAEYTGYVGSNSFGCTPAVRSGTYSG